MTKARIIDCPIGPVGGSGYVDPYLCIPAAEAQGFLRDTMAALIYFYGEGSDPEIYARALLTKLPGEV